MSKSKHELALEIQELRQFCVVLASALRNNALTEDLSEYWWDKLTKYQQVIDPECTCSQVQAPKLNCPRHGLQGVMNE